MKPLLIGRFMLYSREELNGTNHYNFPQPCDLMKIEADGSITEAWHSGIPGDTEPYTMHPPRHYTEHNGEAFINHAGGKLFAIIEVTAVYLKLAPCDGWGKPLRYQIWHRLPPKH